MTRLPLDQNRRRFRYNSVCYVPEVLILQFPWGIALLRWRTPSPCLCPFWALCIWVILFAFKRVISDNEDGVEHDANPTDGCCHEYSHGGNNISCQLCIRLDMAVLSIISSGVYHPIKGYRTYPTIYWILKVMIEWWTVKLMYFPQFFLTCLV